MEIITSFFFKKNVLKSFGPVVSTTARASGFGLRVSGFGLRVCGRNEEAAKFGLEQPVALEAFVARKLRDHQAAGVRFMRLGSGDSGDSGGSDGPRGRVATCSKPIPARVAV